MVQLPVTFVEFPVTVAYAQCMLTTRVSTSPAARQMLYATSFGAEHGKMLPSIHPP
jgi:hypothetical protein